jgi:hypothetical protein
MAKRTSDDWKNIQHRLDVEAGQGIYRGPIKKTQPAAPKAPTSTAPKTYPGGGSERRFEAAKRYNRNFAMLPKKQQENILGGTRKRGK